MASSDKEECSSSSSSRDNDKKKDKLVSILKQSGSSKRRQTKNNEKKGAENRASVVVHAPIVGGMSLGASWKRRWEALAMFSCSLYFIIPSVFGMWAFTIWCLIGHKSSLMGSESPSLLTGLVAGYLGFVFVMDKAPTAGTRPPILRSFRKWWEYSCDYLPLLLVKTADLPTGQGQKYVLGYHPHGIISVGCFGAFATDGARALDLTKQDEQAGDSKDDNKNSKNRSDTATDDHDGGDGGGGGGGGGDDVQENEKRGFSSLFPGLDRRVITLPQNFQTPFLREYFLCMGACTSAKETFRTVLQRPHTALVVVVGGAAESLQSEEGSMDLVLESRKGFCREAILAQAALVPVLGFGETDLYKVVKPSDRMAKVQSILKRLTGCGMPLFQGRSILFQDIGIMPQRKPVVVVVGAPLPPPSWSDPHGGFHPEINHKTGETLNDDAKILNNYHAQYMEALEKLYTDYKNASWNTPGRDRRKSLAIVR